MFCNTPFPLWHNAPLLHLTLLYPQINSDTEPVSERLSPRTPTHLTMHSAPSSRIRSSSGVWERYSLAIYIPALLHVLDCSVWYVLTVGNSARIRNSSLLMHAMPLACYRLHARARAQRAAPPTLPYLVTRNRTKRSFFCPPTFSNAFLTLDFGCCWVLLSFFWKVTQVLVSLNLCIIC